MTHLDLFSGIGGFALAALQVWGKDYECVGVCDIEPYAQQLLKIRFPGVKIYEDIKKLTAADIFSNGRTGRHEEVEPTEAGEQTQHGVKGRIDLLTGGFPCQPFSVAGKRRGTEDDRYLWPEMLRVIIEVKPTWIIGENVAGILSMGGVPETDGVEGEADNGEENNGTTRADGVVWGIVNDLENLGYAIQAFIIPACAVGAPHRRDRIWIVANTRHGNGTWNENEGQYGKEDRQGSTAEPKRPVKCNESGITAHANSIESRTRAGQIGETYSIQEINRTKILSRRISRKNNTTGNTKSTGQQGSEQGQGKIELWGTGTGSSWLEVATRLCGMDDGLPAELDGFKLSKAGHRVARLKGLGNAIVPQVVMEIMRAIKTVEEA